MLTKSLLTEYKVCSKYPVLWNYLITRFLFTIAHTRQFPTIPTTTNMESTVAIATLADSDMMEEFQRTYLVI